MDTSTHHRVTNVTVPVALVEDAEPSTSGIAKQSPSKKRAQPAEAEADAQPAEVDAAPSSSGIAKQSPKKSKKRKKRHSAEAQPAETEAQPAEVDALPSSSGIAKRSHKKSKKHRRKLIQTKLGIPGATVTLVPGVPTGPPAKRLKQSQLSGFLYKVSY